MTDTAPAMTPEQESTKRAHKWIPSTLGHGDSQCVYCKATNHEVAVIGDMNDCPDAPKSTHTPEQESALSKLEAGTHVLVPVEPTGAMMLLGYQAPRDHARCDTRQELAENAIKPIWRAMITAAQEGE